MSVLVKDLEASVEGEPGSPRWWAEVAARIVLVPRLRAVCFYRLSQGARRHHARPIALLLESRALQISGAEISPSADIGPGLCLMHSAGIVIGPEVKIGKGARIYQGVTLGDGHIPGMPQIGDYVTICAGARILGGVRIGNRVVIGSGACVTRDIPDDAVARAEVANSIRPRKPGADARLDSLAQE